MIGLGYCVASRDEDAEARMKKVECRSLLIFDLFDYCDEDGDQLGIPWAKSGVFRGDGFAFGEGFSSKSRIANLLNKVQKIWL